MKKSGRLEPKNIDQVTTMILEAILLASSQKTFCVAGAIINNKTGEVIHIEHNNVLKPLSSNRSFTYDPTAHGERQLVYWYFENRKRLNLPEPANLTIVTSLDPCAMCAGTIVTAGFNVGVVALDNFAGINYDSSYAFDSFPSSLRKKAKALFGYYSSARGPREYIRPYRGGANVALRDTKLTCCNLASCEAMFMKSLNEVRDASNNCGLPPQQMKNPASLPESSPITSAFREIYPNAFRIRTLDPRVPDENIFEELKRVRSVAGNAENAVAYLDPFGNLVLCMADNFELSSVHTAFMELTRNYAIIRWNLMNQHETSDQAELYLTHPKYGTFVFINAPDPTDSRTVMTLGAYGSTMEGPIPITYPPNLQYYYPPRKGTFEQLVSLIRKLPPFYSQFVQISIMQVPGDWK